jgi:hypothetical protein
MDRIGNKNRFDKTGSVKVNNLLAIPQKGNGIACECSRDRIIIARFDDCLSIGDDAIVQWVERELAHPKRHFSLI